MIMNSTNRDRWRELFKILKIFSLYSHYTFILLLFVVKNKDKYKSNQDINIVSTR